jgi:hypothetical protein
VSPCIDKRLLLRPSGVCTVEKLEAAAKRSNLIKMKRKENYGEKVEKSNCIDFGFCVDPISRDLGLYRQHDVAL